MNVRHSFHASLSRGAALLALALLMSPAAPARAERPAYPASPAHDVADTLHGQVLVDPFRWLEEGASPETRRWCEEQNALTRRTLDAFPARADLARRLGELYAIPTTSEPRVCGSRVFFSRRTAGQNQPVVEGIDAPGAAPRVVIDPNVLAADGTVALDWMYPSPDGALIAYGTSPGGSEHSTLHVRDVAKGGDLGESIPNTQHASVAWDPDGSGFVYSRHPEAGEVPAGEEIFHESLAHHRIGDDPARDEIVFDGKGRDIHESRAVWLSSDSKFVFLSTSLDRAKNDLSVRPAGSSDPFRAVAEGVDGTVTGDACQGRLYLLTNVDAPRYRIVTPGPDADPRKWKDVVPQQDGVIEDFTIVHGKLAVRLMVNASSRLRIFSLAGHLEREVALPALGSVSEMAANPTGRSLYLTFVSFTHPAAVYVYDVESHALTTLEPSVPGVRADDYETRQVWFSSKDGTRVPMFLVHRRGLAMDGQRPTLLSGYGGFNISETPAFRADLFPWLERGGVYALASLRGGGEFGRAWHESGRLAKKQNVFDDFHAAAEYLVKSKVTNASRLAARGGSNGGLLMGAVLTQRPELYAAIVCQAPLLDMLRYQRFLMAQYWVPEYGSSEDPQQFRYLLAYSPYQNVRSGVKYPATLITTAEEDSRVDPCHARKMAALLQSRTGSDAPILIRIERKAGHGQGKPVSKRIDEGVDVLSFLMMRLGMN
ncbi:MAG: S9 family peptidase [Candidatus Eisenbacteria bacterium]|nr:S9 family peptidase [Candidatus Eisenbacteria bacterium]